MRSSAFFLFKILLCLTICHGIDGINFFVALCYLLDRQVSKYLSTQVLEKTKRKQLKIYIDQAWSVKYWGQITMRDKNHVAKRRKHFSFGRRHH